MPTPAVLTSSSLLRTPAVKPRYVICPDASRRPEGDRARHDTLPVCPCSKDRETCTLQGTGRDV
jgi:hypothetical protein